LGGLSSGRGQRDATASILRSAPAVLGIRGDHDGDVVIGQCRRQVDAVDDVKRHQLGAGFLQQEFDRRVAAHVGLGCKRQHPKPRTWRRTADAEQLVRAEDVVLDGKAGLLVAEQLRDQRQIEPLAGRRGAVKQLVDQRPPHRAKVPAVKRHLGEPGGADAIGAGCIGDFQ